MLRVETCSLREMTAARRAAMFRLRHETFVRTLGWVRGAQDRQETDAFDAVEDARYVLAGSGARVDACWRMLPTLGPNMLRDLFPVLLHGQAPPASADTWELSRCAIAIEREPPNGRKPHPQVGCGTLLQVLIDASMAFARREGIARFVTVTTTPIERLLRAQGLAVTRAGAPVRIGRTVAVACYVEVG